MHDMTDTTGLEIAIIGMAGRFPGAPDIAAFWRNISGGVDSITRFDRADLAGRVPQALLDAPDFVAAGAPFDGHDSFDAGFFGYSPAEAELLDPQQRVFLECAFHALEDAGHAASRYPGAIGVYASAGMNGYLLNLYGNAAVRDRVTGYEIFTSNDKDFLATRVAYKLNLRGPAVTVQTACSSSLVAVHMAAQALLAGECDMALAGGVAISRQDGYRAMTGSILSPTGQCRAFDATADGTVAGNGVGVVVLKRLEDAIADGDHIEAVIKGSAINNDGGGKASFTAPDVEAQAAAIAAAHAAAQVAPDSITYIEAHGTGTNLGDPVELAALTRAFRRGTERTGFCAIGSVKTNIGHLDTAAGVAGLIKAALMLRHRKLAPSLHFSAPNPRIDFATSPFAVNTVLRDWVADGPLRAGVSSFGIGGTNAHVVLEQPPVVAATRGKGAELLVLSAKSPQALAAQAHALAAWLETHDADPRDVAHTLATGREVFRHRLAVVADGDAPARLRAAAAVQAVDAQAVFLFPGQGSQYPGMARDLYDTVPEFAAMLDRAEAHRGGVLAMIFGDEAIHQTQNAQTVLFVVEYALARLWQGMGVQPAALLGHSLGELTAACLAGVFTFEDGLDLVAARGRLMQAAEPGAMIAVIHPDADIAPLIGGCEIAAENAPGVTTISGSFADIEALQSRLDGAGIGWRPLKTSHAFHSASMDAAADQFAQVVAGMRLNAPQIPVASNLTGDWLTEAQATDPQYWARHLRQTVRFGAAARTAMTLDNAVFVEIGPGATLSTLLRQNGAAHAVPGIAPGRAGWLGPIGAAWAAGLSPDWSRLAGAGRRISLPLYPFQRQRYWIDADTAPTRHVTAGEAQLYIPAWQRAALPPLPARQRKGWLILDDGTTGRALAETLERGGDDAWRVEIGEGFAEPAYRRFTLAPGGAAQLLDALADRGAQVSDIVFLWPLGATDSTALTGALQDLIAALARSPRPVQLTLITRGAADVTGGEDLAPAQALLHGLAMVAGQEYPWLGVRILDLDEGVGADWLRHVLLADTAPIAARRGGRLWHLAHRTQPVDPTQALRRNGVFVVAGHIAEGIGRVWVERLAAIQGARLALILDPAAAPFPSDALQLTADCTDPAALGAALDRVAAEWGRIDGVFLSTPFSDGQSTAPLALLGRSQWDRVHATNIAPAKALAQAAASRRIGFCMLQSSLSSAIGGVGLGAYAGAHAHTDLFAAAQSRTGKTDWYAVGWDALATGRRGPEEFALTPDQVWAMTLAVIAGRVTGASIVSRADLDARRAEWLNPAPRLEDTAVSNRQRPALDTPFVAPRTGTEAAVAAVLQDLLGLDRIGVDDGFFELGGHSLLAIRAIAKLREAFPVQIEMRELLLDNPSAASIARLIDGKLAGDDDLAALMAEVASLSPEDLQAALAEGAE